MATSRAPSENPLPAPPYSDKPAIDIHLLHCGSGDTILIRLPGDRWGLIDCYLPVQDGIRAAFFEFIDKHNIKTFDFIIQTHPDRDHYHGMKVVIEHFLARGANLGYYIDTGVSAGRARDLLQDRASANEYQILQDSLEEWARAGRLKWCELAARYRSLIPEGFQGEIELIPIGPDPDEKRRLLTSDLRKLARRPAARLVANQLSLVVVLLVKISGRSLGVFLGADACAESLDWALDYWTQYTEDTGLAPAFDAIKIPHHGSIRSHSPRLPKMKRAGLGGGTAVVSAGIRKALPDREVLRDYLLEGWDVKLTTTRGKKRSANLPMTLANRGRPDEYEMSRFSLHLSWSPLDGLRAEPAAASVVLDQLIHYETAKV